MVSTEYQLQVLGIHWNIGPITTCRSGRKGHPAMTGTSGLDDRSGERSVHASDTVKIGHVKGYSRRIGHIGCSIPV
jgi:hypothetical protein